MLQPEGYDILLPVVSVVTPDGTEMDLDSNQISYNEVQSQPGSSTSHEHDHGCYQPEGYDILLPVVTPDGTEMDLDS